MGKKKSSKSNLKNKTNTKKQSEQSLWALQERVVALIEKAIDPDATITRNVFLPNLVTGKKRQCDIVIEVGKPPRVTTTLVEVQKRKSRVKISDISNWWEKKKQLGAQHIICVSELAFPKSAIDQVEQVYGPSMRLVRLSNLEKGDWPIQIVDNSMRLKIQKFKLDSTRHFQLDCVGIKTGSIGIDVKQPIFSSDEWQEQISFNDLFLRLNEKASRVFLPESALTGEMRFEPGKSEVFVFIQDETRKLNSITYPILIEHQQQDVPIIMSSYCQHGHDGAIAWMASVSFHADDKNGEIRIVFVPTGKGNFKIAGVEHQGIIGGVVEFSAMK